ncbi:MAG: hypothetical protein ACH37Z_04180 [Anaerolineae bacterium]
MTEKTLFPPPSRRLKGVDVPAQPAQEVSTKSADDQHARMSEADGESSRTPPPDQLEEDASAREDPDPPQPTRPEPTALHEIDSFVVIETPPILPDVSPPAAAEPLLDPSTGNHADDSFLVLTPASTVDIPETSLPTLPKEINSAILKLPYTSAAQLEDAIARGILRRQVPDDRWDGSLWTRGHSTLVLLIGPTDSGKETVAAIMAYECGFTATLQVNLLRELRRSPTDLPERLAQLVPDANPPAFLYIDGAQTLIEAVDPTPPQTDPDRPALRRAWEALRDINGVVVLAVEHLDSAGDNFLQQVHGIVDLPPLNQDVRAAVVNSWFSDGTRPAPASLKAWVAAVRLGDDGFRNVVIGAAASALSADGTIGPISVLHLVKATAIEYQKLGRSVTRADWGDAMYDLHILSGALPKGKHAPGDADLLRWAGKVRLADDSIRNVIRAVSSAAESDFTLRQMVKATAEELLRLGLAAGRAELGDDLFDLLA